MSIIWYDGKDYSKKDALLFNANKKMAKLKRKYKIKTKHMIGITRIIIDLHEIAEPSDVEFNKVFRGSLNEYNKS